MRRADRLFELIEILRRAKNRSQLPQLRQSWKCASAPFIATSPRLFHAGFRSVGKLVWDIFSKPDFTCRRSC